MALSDRAESDRPNANVSDADSNSPQPLLASDTPVQSDFTLSITANKPISIPIARLNRSMHGRASRDESHVQKLIALKRQGETFLPIDVFWDRVNDALWIGDGVHRTTVYECTEETHIPANIHEGGREEALAFAMKCDRGLRRKPEDNEHCIRSLLENPEWAQWSSHVIADKLELNRRTVDRIRRRIEGDQASPRIGADNKVRKPRTSTGALPQLSGRKLTDDLGKPNEDLQRADRPEQLHRQLKQADTEAALADLIRQLVGESHPDVLQEILDYLPKVVTSDASLDAKAIIAHALVWGFDSLGNAPESSRYKRTPRQCYALVKDVTSNIGARSYTIPADEPRRLDVVDYIQQVLGSNILTPDEIHMALKSIRKMPACNEPVKHVRFLLSSNRDIFRRIEGKEGLVGVYLAEDNPYRLGANMVANDQGDVVRKLDS